MWRANNPRVATAKADRGTSNHCAWMDVVTGKLRIITASQNAGALPTDVSFSDLVCVSLTTHHTSTPSKAQMIATVIARPYSLAISTNKKYGPAYWL